MKSCSIIPLSPSLVMMILFLISIADPILASSSDHSSGSLKNESIELVFETTTKPNTNQQLSIIIGEDSPYFLGTINTLIGFASSVTSLYSFFDTLFKPETPQHTVTDVLNKMDVEFTQVKRDLHVIKEMLNKQELYQYGEVEGAVYGFLNDLQHSSPVDIPSRAVKLYDQLDIFMKGLLGQTTGLFPDLLVSVRDLYDCGSGSIQKKIHQFMSLVNIGTGGLAYYSKKINNKIIFDGEQRTNALSTKYEAIRKRLTYTMTTCAEMSTAVIDKYISKILSLNLDKSTQEICKLLYERFNDVYPPYNSYHTLTNPKIDWFFYTAWDFKPSSGNEKVPKSGQSYNMVYTGSGKSGVTKYDRWSVYWIGHPANYFPTKSIAVNVKALINLAIGMTWDLPWDRSAKYIQSHITPSIFDPSSRTPVASMIFTYPSTYATTGKPDEDGLFRPYFIHRIRGFSWTFEGFFGPSWYECIIDVIMF